MGWDGDGDGAVEGTHRIHASVSWERVDLYVYIIPFDALCSMLLVSATLMIFLY
jgi:hypothetical protein